MTTVLFACVHNAGRSKMAEAFFNALADPARAHAISAGTRPASRAHAEVISAMREVGLELEGAAPTFLSETVARSADLLVTMGCGEECPFIPGLRRLDWQLADPKGASPEHVRAIRDEIRARVRELLSSNGWLPAVRE
jgi:arsenate reductase